MRLTNPDYCVLQDWRHGETGTNRRSSFSSLEVTHYLQKFFPLSTKILALRGSYGANRLLRVEYTNDRYLIVGDEGAYGCNPLYKRQLGGRVLTINNVRRIFVPFIGDMSIPHSRNIARFLWTLQRERTSKVHNKNQEYSRNRFNKYVKDLYEYVELFDLIYHPEPLFRAIAECVDCYVKRKEVTPGGLFLESVCTLNMFIKCLEHI